MSLSNASEFNSVGGGFGGGFGGFGGIAPVGVIGLNTLFDRRRDGGDCDGDGGGGGKIFAAATLSKLGSIEAAIPVAALATQNAILEQTIALSSIANQNNLCC